MSKIAFQMIGKSNVSFFPTTCSGWQQRDCIALYYWIFVSEIPRWPVDHAQRGWSCIVIMGAITSQITSLTIVYSIAIQTQIKENIKAPSHWPLCWEFTGDRWIPRTNGQLRGKYFHLMTSSWRKSFPSQDASYNMQTTPVEQWKIASI